MLRSVNFQQDLFKKSVTGEIKIPTFNDTKIDDFSIFTGLTFSGSGSFINSFTI